ncbi:unnamed protein product [Rhodiola kirilowii]
MCSLKRRRSLTSSSSNIASSLRRLKGEDTHWVALLTSKPTFVSP